MKKNSLKSVLTNVSLLAVSLLLFYLVAEFAARTWLEHLPRSSFNLFARELKTLGQTSKKGLLPESPYILIVGDSYGTGRGDWFINLGFDRNSRYQATHLLQDSFGTDVFTLSRAGAGNFDGLALFSINSKCSSLCAGLFSLAFST